MATGTNRFCKHNGSAPAADLTRNLEVGKRLPLRPQTHDRGPEAKTLARQSRGGPVGPGKPSRRPLATW
eukprot:10397396-Lingulodinium_polyedra.AAC.1